MKSYSGAILVDRNGGVLLQRRDDKPGIKDPGLLSIFAGASLPNETKEQTAIREIREETRLDISGRMTFFKKFAFEDAPSAIFIVKVVERSSIRLAEGDGVERVADYNDFLNRKDLTTKTKRILTEYYKSL